MLRVSRETKGRGGKAVTLVRGAPLDAAGLVTLGKQLRTLCGSGGTVKDGVIEVQGDHVERVIEALKAQGHTVKRSSTRRAPPASPRAPSSPTGGCSAACRSPR